MKAGATQDGALLSGELRIAGRLDARFFALLEALHAGQLFTAPIEFDSPRG